MEAYNPSGLEKKLESKLFILQAYFLIILLQVVGVCTKAQLLCV